MDRMGGREGRTEAPTRDAPAARGGWPVDVLCGALLLVALVTPAFAEPQPDRSVESAAPGGAQRPEPPGIELPSAPREEPPAIAPPPQELTAEMVRARLEQVQNVKELDEAVRKRAIDLYNQALEQLQIAEEHANRIATLAQARQQAPAAIADLQARAAEPATEPTIEVLPEHDTTYLQQELQAADVELAAAKRWLADLQAQRARRDDRRLKNPEELPAAKQRLEEVERALAAPPLATEPAEIAAANRTLLQARRRALVREIEKLEMEVPAYDATRELLTLQLAEATRRVARAEKVRQLWEQAVQRRRTREANEIARWVRELQQHAPPALAQAPLTQRVKEVAESRTRPLGLPDLIRRATLEFAGLEERHQRLVEDHAALEQKLKLAGIEQIIGPLLLRQRRELPDVRKLRREILAREREVSRVRLDLLNLENERARLPNVEAQLAEVRSELPESEFDEPPEEIDRWLRGLVESWRNLLDSEIADRHTYLNRLVELSGLQQSLVEVTIRLRDEIDRHILWVRSTERFGAAQFRQAAEAVAWLSDGDHWRETGQALWNAIAADPFIACGALLAVVYLLACRWRFRRRLHECGERAAESYTQPFRHTALALWWTLLIALPWPGLLWFVGWRLAGYVDSSDFARGVGLALVATAGLYLPLELYRQVLRPQGLAAQHFRWHPDRLRLNRETWNWLEFLGLPLMFLVSLTQAQDQIERRDSLGRLALIAGLLLLSALIARLLRPALASPRSWMSEDRTVSRWKFAAYVVAVSAPLVLVGLAVMGYYYTALALTLRLIASVGLVLGLILAHALIARWLYALRARLALEQAAARQSPAEAEQSITDAAGRTVLAGNETVEIPRQTLDLGKINQQTRRLLRNVTTVAAIFGFWLIWADLLPALRFLDWTIWSTEVEVTRPITRADETIDYVTVQEQRAFTVGHLLKAAVILMVVVVAARNLPGLLHVAVLQYLPLDAGGLYAVKTLVRYAIVMIGVVITFGVAGVAWGHVQWLVAALGVGLGFGLQEIFANFISGLILLFERPIRVGDVVTVENVSGVVVDIRMRATTVRDWDYKEFIIPNKDLVTGKLLNWTLTSPTNRLVVNVGVSYDCRDTDLVHELLLKVARANPHVLDDPPPNAIFDGFGENRLNFVLRAYLPNLENRLAVIHDLHSSILREFRQAGIEIALPQRDIHIRSIQGVLPVEERNGRRRDESRGDAGRRSIFSERREDRG